MASHLVLHVNGEARTLCGLPFTVRMELAREGDPSCPNCRHLDEIGANGVSLALKAASVVPPPTAHQPAAPTVQNRGTLTHYLPAFTEANGPKRRTVCGEWIKTSQHSAEPTCSYCAAWLVEDAQSAQETIDADPELAAYFAKGGQS